MKNKLLTSVFLLFSSAAQGPRGQRFGAWSKTLWPAGPHRRGRPSQRAWRWEDLPPRGEIRHRLQEPDLPHQAKVIFPPPPQKKTQINNVVFITECFLLLCVLFVVQDKFYEVNSRPYPCPQKGWSKERIFPFLCAQKNYALWAPPGRWYKRIYHPQLSCFWLLSYPYLG